GPLEWKAVVSCRPELLQEPELDYLAKDYASFRGLMLDRMAALTPEWQERSPADGHVALVELLAYTADGLSYEQDAVATQAYLGTARRRLSLRPPPRPRGCPPPASARAATRARASSRSRTPAPTARP